MVNLERGVAPDPHELLPSVPGFSVESDDVVDSKAIDTRFTHPGTGGANISPHLRWSGFPAETKGFAVSCYDPDAPTGSGFWHWIVWDIPGSVTELATGASNNAMPEGSVEGRTDFGTFGYGGPAPPSGDRAHRYVFSVYALDTDTLGLAADTPAAQVGFNLTFHTLGRGAIRPTFTPARA